MENRSDERRIKVSDTLKFKTPKRSSLQLLSLFLKTQCCASKWDFIVLMEIIAFVAIIGLLIASLTVDKLQHSTIWSLRLWKWCVLVISIFCGRLPSEYVIKFLLYLIWKFWLDKKVLYFVYGVKKSVQFFVWVGLVALAWGFLFDYFDVHRSKDTNEAVRRATRGIVGCLIGVAIWVVKTVLVKLVGSFHASKMFEKIEESIRHRKTIIALSDSNSSNISSAQDQDDQICEDESKKSTKELSYEEKKEIMNELIGGIRDKKLVDLSYTSYSIEAKQEDGSITTSEMRAKYVETQKIKDKAGATKAAVEIFATMAMPPPNEQYVELDKLLKNVVDKNVRETFEDAAEDHEESKKKCIKRSVFKKWLVKVYSDHESLNRTLENRKLAVDELNMLASVIVLLVIIIAWLLFMGIFTTEVLVFISSQLLLLVFMFGNTCRTAFESIIFVFVMHPFDIGDLCVVDGVQMSVDEMNLLNTIFLRYDGEKIYYPNSVLASKPVSNLYRSPPMGDSLEFAIDLSTSETTIQNLREKIKDYVDKNERRWSSDHSVYFKEIENMNKMKMPLHVTHTVSYHYVDKRASRRSDLVLAMKNIFERLEIKYNLLPQQVQLIS